MLRCTSLVPPAIVIERSPRYCSRPASVERRVRRRPSAPRTDRAARSPVSENSCTSVVPKSFIAADRCGLRRSLQRVGQRAHAGVAHDRRLDREVGELLAHVRIVGLALLARGRDQPLERPGRRGCRRRCRSARSPARSRRSPSPALRSPSRLVDRHAHVGHEDLVELGVAVDLPDRLDLDARALACPSAAASGRPTSDLRSRCGPGRSTSPRCARAWSRSSGR